jgi:hypothetical protein
MLKVVMRSVIMLSVMLSVVTLSVVMLSVVMLRVVPLVPKSYICRTLYKDSTDPKLPNTLAYYGKE